MSRQVRGAGAGLAAAGDEDDGDQGRDERDGDEERPERHDAGGGAGDDEGAEDDRLGGAHDGERAAGRPEPFPVRQRAGEEPDPHGVPGAGGHEGVDERAGAVARAGVRDADLPPQRPIAQRQVAAAARTETAKPRPATQSHFGSAVPTVSSAWATRVPRICGVATAASSASRSRAGSGEAAAADSRADLVECRVHNLAFRCSDV